MRVHTVKAGAKRGAISTSKQRFVGSLFISSSFGEQRTWEQKIGRKRAINWRIPIKLNSFDESSSKIERYGSRSGLIAILGQQVLHVIFRQSMLLELQERRLEREASRQKSTAKNFSRCLIEQKLRNKSFNRDVIRQKVCDYYRKIITFNQISKKA